MEDILETTEKRSLLKRIKRKVRRVLRKVKRYVLRYPQTIKGNERDPKSEKPRVIVSGRNYCSNLCIARALGKAGYEVEVLRIFRVRPKRANLLAILKPDAYSKYIKAYHVCITGKHEERIINRLISLADPNRKMLIVPADDVVAEVIDKYYDQLRDYYMMPNINDQQGQINHMMSKAVQKELAEAAGLPIINSCMIKTVDGQFEIPETVKYPCFIKPDVSPNGLKSKMQKCEDEQELRAVLTAMAENKDVEILVQDYLEIGREYSILGLSTKNGAIGPGYFGAEQGGHNERRGVALTGKVVPCGERQQLIDQIVEFVGTLNFDGLYDVDLIETTDGKMYFVELNLRFGGSGYAITESGVNLPGMFADYMLLNKPVDMNCQVTEHGKTFISEKIMLEEYTKGFLQKSEMKPLMDSVDIHFIYDEQDPQAYNHFKKFYPVASLMKVYYKIKASRQKK